MRFAFIETEKAGVPVALMCRILAVSRAGFYAWRVRAAARRTREDGTLAVAVAAIYAGRHRRYGSPRVRMELRERGQRTGRKRIAQLMRIQGLRARPRRRYRTTTDSRHGLPVCPNLLARRFAGAQPNTAWATDMTYLWTAQGWLYLAAIIDLFSRRVVGWSMSERIDRKLALDAPRMALAQRRLQRGLIRHADRGSQYASRDYPQPLIQHGLRASISNAVAESFFASLKLELVYQVQWRTRAEARTAIFEYLELFYNRRRRHSSLGYRSPAEFERCNYRRWAA